MKHILPGLLLAISVVIVGCSSPPTPDSKVATDRSSSWSMEAQLVEAACGQCQFGMEGAGCDLAIRVGKDTFWVDGTGIDDHGDAHGDDGLCNCVREAVVSGTVVDGRFSTTSFELKSKATSAN